MARRRTNGEGTPQVTWRFIKNDTYRTRTQCNGTRTRTNRSRPKESSTSTSTALLSTSTKSTEKSKSCQNKALPEIEFRRPADFATIPRILADYAAVLALNRTRTQGAARYSDSNLCRVEGCPGFAQVKRTNFRPRTTGVCTELSSRLRGILVRRRILTVEFLCRHEQIGVETIPVTCDRC